MKRIRQFLNLRGNYFPDRTYRFENFFFWGYTATPPSTTSRKSQKTAIFEKRYDARQLGGSPYGSNKNKKKVLNPFFLLRPCYCTKSD